MFFLVFGSGGLNGSTYCWYMGRSLIFESKSSEPFNFRGLAWGERGEGEKKKEKGINKGRRRGGSVGSDGRASQLQRPSVEALSSGYTSSPVHIRSLRSRQTEVK